MFFKFTALTPRVARFCVSNCGGGKCLRSSAPRCVVGVEACATAHYSARELGAPGHEVRMMPAQYVKAYIKRNKHDAAERKQFARRLADRPCDLFRLRRQSNRRPSCCIVAASS